MENGYLSPSYCLSAQAQKGIRCAGAACSEHLLLRGFLHSPPHPQSVLITPICAVSRDGAWYVCRVSIRWSNLETLWWDTVTYKVNAHEPPTPIICLKQVYDLCWAAFIAVLGPMQPTDSGQTYLELIHSLACLS